VHAKVDTVGEIAALASGTVTLAKAGVQFVPLWIPADASMTEFANRIKGCQARSQHPQRRHQGMPSPPPCGYTADMFFEQIPSAYHHIRKIGNRHSSD
jgi:hypothetical protein